MQIAVSTPSDRGFCRETLENRGEIHRGEGRKYQQDADGEAHVADARDDERFFARVGRRFLQEPEADQQVAAQAHAFPSDEHHDQVRGQHQRQHEEHEQIQVAEEAVVAAFVRHVAGRIDVDQHADEGNHQQHHHGKLVHLQREIHAERPGRPSR